MTESELKKHLEAAEKSPKQVAAAVLGLPEKVLRYKPAPDRWCIQEILGHLADVEIAVLEMDGTISVIPRSPETTMHRLRKVKSTRNR